MEFYATCPAGFEALLAHELSRLGVPQVRPLRGQVAFGGTLENAYTACLWSRLASRVVVVLARGGARNADELYETVASLAWEDHLGADARFAVDAHGTNEQLRNTQFVALRTKDAIVDRMLARTGVRPQTATSNPNLSLAVRITRERASIGIDLAGTPLFRRGYEAARGGRQAAPPLRADYAAALLELGGWHELCRKGTPTFVTLTSGAGTLAFEAAAQACHQAPGLLRTRWGFDGWAGHDVRTWERLVHEARTRAEEPHNNPPVLLVSDTRPGCEAAVRQALRAAGLSIEPQFSETPSLEGLSAPALLACDYSWIADYDLAAKAQALTRLAQVHTSPALEAAAVLAPSELCDLLLGAPAQTQEVVVGRTPQTMRLYHPQDTTEATPAPTAQVGSVSIPVLLSSSQQFASRLAKVAKQRRKWARREDVSCYRVYDADLPDYAVSIDLFEGSRTPGTWLQIYEYAPPKNVDATKAQARLLDVVALAPQVLGVDPANTFVRTRTKARGGSQYANETRPTRPGRGRRGGTPLPPGAHLVDEGGLTFEVNFSLRLDCGLFLDHRDTRAQLREMAKQTKGSKRFLNLFAYTGSGTCYAADGGARYTTTVDLSRPSLDWAQRNMARNGFDGPEHEFVQADVTKWVSEQRRTRNRWDLVFCDVPTFSNSSRMGKASFDVQRDHAELLIGVSRLLTREGVCVFSCNLRTFKLDEEKLAKAGVVAEDITAQTIPEDFSRNPRIHRCYLIRRQQLPATRR